MHREERPETTYCLEYIAEMDDAEIALEDARLFVFKRIVYEARSHFIYVVVVHIMKVLQKS